GLVTGAVERPHRRGPRPARRVPRPAREDRLRCPVVDAQVAGAAARPVRVEAVDRADHAALDVRVRVLAGPALLREVVILAHRSGLDRLADPGQLLECELRTEEQRAHDEDEYA